MDQTTDYEALVLSAAITQSRVLDLLDASIHEDVFRKSIHLNIFRKMIEYGPLTDLTIIHTVYPNWQPVEATQPLSVYLGHLVETRAQDELIERITVAINDGEFNAHVNGIIATEVQQKYRFGSVAESTDIHPHAVANSAEILRRQRTQGIPFGLPSLDKATSGWQPGQLITLTALAKQGKTTALVKMMYAAKIAGRNILFCSFEMTTDELLRMYVSLAFEVDLTALREGSLTKKERDRVGAEIRRLRTLEGARIIDTRREIDTITKLRGLHTTFEPDLIIVDGIYMMTDEQGEPSGSPRAITNITRGLKELAMEREIPVVASTQSLMSKTVRGKLNMYSGGYSSSYAQDSDVLLGLRRLGGDYVEIEILAMRSGVPTLAYVKVDWVNGDISEVDRGDAGLLAVLDPSGNGGSSTGHPASAL